MSIDLTVAILSAFLLFLFLWSAGSWGKTASRNIYDQQTSNRQWTWYLVGAFSLFIAFLGLGLDVFVLGMPLPALGLNSGGNPFPMGTKEYWDFIEMQHQTMGVPWAGICAFVGSALMSYFNFINAPNMVLGAAQARSPNLNEPKEVQLVNVVRELTIAAGIPAPKVYVIPEMDLNAFACGTSLENSHIAVTQGLLNALDREELQGVLAHELSHVKNRDVELMTMVVALAGTAALVSDWAQRSMRHRGSVSSSSGSKDRGKGGGLFLVWFLLIVLAPLISRLMAMAVSRRREYLADASGAEITRNPISLANALEKIRAAADPTHSLRSDSFAHLCIDDPNGSALSDKEGFVAEVFSTHPPISQRIKALREMAYLYKPVA